MPQAVPSAQPVKPKLRGFPTLIGLLLIAPVVALLMVEAPAGAARAATAIYGASLAALLGISALYHIPMWGERARAWMRRLDHSAIFLLIAGTYTPPCLLVLDGVDSTLLLVVVWVGAALGIAIALLWPDAPRLVNAVLAIALGWMMIPFGSAIMGALEGIDLFLLFLGGGMYSFGALAYVRRWPNPWPRFYGYHEVFHTLVVLAGVAHFAVMWRLVTGATIG